MRRIIAARGKEWPLLGGPGRGGAGRAGRHLPITYFTVETNTGKQYISRDLERCAAQKGGKEAESSLVGERRVITGRGKAGIAGAERGERVRGSSEVLLPAPPD